MFGRNSKKTDYRVRFQNPLFRQHLKQARGYKRNRKLPTTKWEIFFAGLGLDSWYAKALTLGIFLFLVYLVFIPNLFFIKHINIQSSGNADIGSVENTTNLFLNKYTPWPQKNLLLLSKAKLKDYLLQNNQLVQSVDKISKHLPSTLTITITPRQNRFVLQAATSTYYSLSGDGLITDQIFENASGTLPTNLSLIRLDGGEMINLRQQLLPREKMNFLNELQNQLAGILKMPISYYQLNGSQTADVTVYTQNDLKLLFNLQSDPKETLTRFNLLFSQLSDPDKKRLSYVDMRFLDKGYLCYKNTACVNNVVLPNSQASSTPATN